VRLWLDGWKGLSLPAFTLLSLLSSSLPLSLREQSGIQGLSTGIPENSTCVHRRYYMVARRYELYV